MNDVTQDVALAFEAVGASYRDKRGVDVAALFDVDFSVARNTVQAIVGASGAGKSTLFRCAATLHKANVGRVVVGGVDVAAADEWRLRDLRRTLGVVSQQLHLLSSRTAAENVALPLELIGVDRLQRQQRVGELLEWVGLSAYAHRYPSQLSGGQRQRVAIARALATSPALLLCDEPTSALDPDTSSSILALIARVRAELGVTVVIVTHDVGVVHRLADDVIVLDAGRIVRRGAPRDVLTSERAA